MKLISIISSKVLQSGFKYQKEHLLRTSVFLNNLLKKPKTKCFNGVAMKIQELKQFTRKAQFILQNIIALSLNNNFIAAMMLLL